MVAIDLSPAEVDIKGVRSGDRNLIQLTVRVGGQPMNLTGYTVTASARTKADEPTHLDAVCTVTTAAAGKVDVRWPGDAVKTWLGTNVEQNGLWDLQLQQGTDDPWTIVWGTFQAILDVTHA
jgi:hypothetical protein